MPGKVVSLCVFLWQVLWSDDVWLKVQVSVCVLWAVFQANFRQLTIRHYSGKHVPQTGADAVAVKHTQ